MYFNLIGVDGSGKDTQKDLLLPFFQNPVLTREPGGTVEAEIIREVILNKEFNDVDRIQKIEFLLQQNINSNTKNLLEKSLIEIQEKSINGVAEMYLYAASRSESLEKVVSPAVSKKQFVIGNRSVACSVSYQGNARGLGMERVWKVNEPIVRSTLPDVEFFLDIPIQVTMERLSNRLEKQDRLDGETIEFHEKTREGYLYFYKHLCPYKYEIIDANGNIEEVHQKVKKALKKYDIL